MSRWAISWRLEEADALRHYMRPDVLVEAVPLLRSSRHGCAMSFEGAGTWRHAKGGTGHCQRSGASTIRVGKGVGGLRTSTHDRRQRLLVYPSPVESDLASPHGLLFASTRDKPKTHQAAQH